MFGIAIPPILPTTGGEGVSGALGLISLVVLAAVTWIWIASMKRRPRVDTTVRSITPQGEKKAA